MKVLHICESYEGGVKTHIDQIYKHNESTVENIFIVSSKRTKGKVNENFYIVNGISKFKNPVNYFKAIRTIFNYIKKEKPNIVHYHSTLAALISIVLRPFLRKEVIFFYTPHAYYSQGKMNTIKRKIVILIEKYLLSKMNMVIHVSKAEENYAISEKILKDIKKSTVIYNGVDLSVETIKKVKKDNNIIINIARCEAQKNPFKFIDIAREVLNINDSFKFFYIGDGSLIEECKQKVKEYRLTESVYFLGYKENVNDYILNADLYLSTSLYEGLPYAVIEAMSNSLPLVLSDVIGHKELINNNGILYKLNDTNENIAREIINVFVDRDIVERYSENSFKLYLDNFVSSNNIKKLFHLYLKFEKGAKYD